MNDIDKRLEEKVERILSFDAHNSIKLTQSSMTIEEHSHLMREVFEEDIPELISTLKAEREAVNRSHKQLNQKSEQIDHVLEQLQAEREEKERLKKALEFYADTKNYEETEYKTDDWLPTLPIDRDHGEKARSALGGDRE